MLNNIFLGFLTWTFSAAAFVVVITACLKAWAPDDRFDFFVFAFGGMSVFLAVVLISGVLLITLLQPPGGMHE